MEIFLSVIILIFIIIIFSKQNSNLNLLRKDISLLKDLINNLKSEIAKQEIKSVQEVIIPKITPKVEDVKPITPIVQEQKVEKPIQIPNAQIVQQQPIKPTIRVENTSINVQATPNVQRPITPKIPQKPVDNRSFWDKFREKNPDLEKFVGENLISKIGIVMLVLGIAYFVKYAIDRDWIPPVGRVGIGILSGSIVLGFAHKLRLNFKSFSSILVAGAIAIFYFTIGIAFHEYQIFSQTVAFALMVVITLFSVFFTIYYDRKELGILSLIGGFAVPFMVSSGDGNYQVLFSYLLILNIGMLVLSFYKNWNIIKLLSFIFTQLIYIVWLLNNEESDFKPYYGALFFASCFFLVFLVMNMIYKLKVKAEFSIREVVLIMCNNFIFYAVGMFIIHQIQPDFKGVFTLIMAAINFVMARILMNKNKVDSNTIYVLIGTTLALITLIAPVQLQGNYITIFWAVEAVLLAFLFKKSKIQGFMFASIIVHTLMGLSLLIDWIKFFDAEIAVPMVLNTVFITGITCITSLFGTYKLTHSSEDKIPYIGLELTKYAQILFVLTGMTIYLVGFIETITQADKYYWVEESFLSVGFCYHLIMIVGLLFLFWKSKSIIWINTITIFSYLTLFLYITIFIFVPFSGFENQLPEYNEKISWFLNYVNLGLITTIIFILIKIKQNNEKALFFSEAWLTRIFVFLAVFIVSNQVLFNGIIFNRETILKSKDFYVEFDEMLTQFYKILLPITWGILSFIFLYLGFNKSWKNMRIASLILLLITLLKLFIYDIRDVSEAGKIIAFILLAILILVMAFMYQKIKKVLIDEKKEDKS